MPQPILLETINLTKIFERQKAVDAVSIKIYEGESVGLVGESGSGKSTLARLVLGLIPPTEGRIDLKSRGQLVFQDPQTSLNPRIKIGEAIAEPAKIQHLEPRLDQLLSLVKLPVSYANRYPHELSGGERQRVGIARALASQPKFLVLDEPVSALDVAIQLDILTLLNELKQKLGLTYIFIAHDPAVVWFICQRALVMKEGRVIESVARPAGCC